MKLNGLHHITAVTADAPGNVDFYARVLGLRLVKKSVNQDDPLVYHLFYGDENAHPGADLTFFEYPDAPLGRAGDGMAYRVVWKVANSDAIAYWSERLAAEGVELQVNEQGNVSFAENDATATGLVFKDPEGLEHELITVDDGNEPLTANATDIPAEFRLQGFAGVRVYASQPSSSRDFLAKLLNFEHTNSGDDSDWTIKGDSRTSRYAYDEPPGGGMRGAGTIHHVAWTSANDEHSAWQNFLSDAGARPTPVIDRYYFESIYFTEPSGVLFELATPSPGFTADEPLETLGERLSLPPKFEPLRDQLEVTLTPLPNPRLAKQS